MLDSIFSEQGKVLSERLTTAWQQAAVVYTFAAHQNTETQDALLGEYSVHGVNTVCTYKTAVMCKSSRIHLTRKLSKQMLVSQSFRRDLKEIVSLQMKRNMQQSTWSPICTSDQQNIYIPTLLPLNILALTLPILLKNAWLLCDSLSMYCLRPLLHRSCSTR